MKKLALLASIAFLLFNFGSCTKDKTQQPVVCVQTDTLNTYTLSAKAILDGECLGSGCHGGSGVSGVILDNYTAAVASAKSKSNFFCTIEFACGPTMPKGYSFPIDTPEINALKRWRDNCYAQ